MTRTRDGLTQIVQATDAQVTYYAAQGYTRADGGTGPIAPVLSIVRSVTVIGGQLVVTYADGTQVTLGGIGGVGTSGGGFAYDGDGVAYLAEPGTVGAVGYGHDSDGVPYLLPAA